MSYPGRMSDSVPAKAERRAGSRYVACYPGYVVLPDGAQRIAVIRDLSVSGVCLLMDTLKVQIGDNVQLELHIGEDPDDRRVVQGRVVRAEPLTDTDLWKLCVAVTFDEVLTMCEEDIARFNDLPPALAVDSDPTD